MPDHRWSGWPGAWCLDCGDPDPMELALIGVKREATECAEPHSHRNDPYWQRLQDPVICGCPSDA